VKTKQITLAGLLILSSALPFFALRASAEDAPKTADLLATDAGADATDAGEDADADAGPPPLPAFDEAPFPEEKSPRPKDAEWKTAPEVALSPGSYTFDCKAFRIREWIRIGCGRTVAQITMLGGNDPKEVHLAMEGIKEEWQSFPEGGEIVFPVRRGDRRVFEWITVEFGYKGSTNASSLFVLSEAWLPDEEKPMIFLR